MGNPGRNKDSAGKGTGLLAFDRIVAGILLLVFVLVIVTGVVTYIRLNRIVETVSEGIRPDEKLLLVKDIFNNLSDAENSVKSYSLTRNETYLSHFFQMVQETETDFERLMDLTREGDIMQPYIDSLDVLVEKKFEILDDMLVIQDEYRVQQALNKVVESIQESQAADTVMAVADTGIAITDTAAVAEKERRGFFARLFSKKEKDTVVEKNPVVEEELPDTVRETSLEKISQQIREVRSVEMERESRLRAREWALIQQDKQVMDRIRLLLDQLEYLERYSYSVRTKEAEVNAREISVIIAIFCVAASLLLIFAAYTIARYVRSNNRYRKALKLANDEARELARARERFLANMSHEIRTPMNVISGFTGQLMHTELTGEQKEYLSLVQKSADHLTHILNDVLDYSKLEADRMKLAESVIDLPRLLEDTEQQFKPLAKEKNLLLSTTKDPELPRFILGDAVRLRQILFNLVGNSVKFTGSGEIDIIVSSGQNKEGTVPVRFEIRDTGIGIKENDLENIFREFEQGTGDQGQSTAGTGLGLTITRKLVELHNGTIDIKSETGKGTSVIVTIPYKIWEGKDPGDETGIQPGQTLPAGLKILVVDDEEFNRKLLNTILRRYGGDVKEASGGTEALDLVMRNDFDIVLTDNRMPDMGGRELCERIRSLNDPVKATMPVIVITAVVSYKDQEEYRASGMDAFIPKPFEEKNLIGTIQKVVGRHKNDAVPAWTKEQKGRAVYSLEGMKRLSGNDPAFFEEMLDLFIENTARGFDILQERMEAGDDHSMREQAHKMSAPCKHLEADKLYRLLKEIEHGGGHPTDPDRMEAIFKAARSEFMMIRADIEKNRNE